MNHFEMDHDMFCNSLTGWYRLNRRELPWRGDEEYFRRNHLAPIPVSAYGIWVSEVMSQQTRIETVIPYWLKWMEKYPTVRDLAEASPEDVNTLWAGLGYYRRCRFLLAGAKEVVEKHGGEVPRTVKELLSIPGIGPYTAGAIASIAFGVVVPAVDGNVLRVMSRVLTLKEPINAHAAGLEKVVYGRTQQIMQDSMPDAGTDQGADYSQWPCTPSEFNQALMELGALVCTPSSPACEKPVAGSENQPSVCPVQSVCLARANSTVVKEIYGPCDARGDCSEPITSVTIFPMKALKIKRAPPEFTYVVAVVRAQSDAAGMHTYLFSRRPSSGLLAGQWEFPNTLIASNEGVDHSANKKSGKKSKVQCTSTDPDLSVAEVKKVVGSRPRDDNCSATNSIIVGGGAVDAEALVSPLLFELSQRYGVVFSFSNDKKTKAKQKGGANALVLRCLVGPQVLPGVITHVFSHQVHKMHVVLLDVEHCSGDSNCSASALSENTGTSTSTDIEWMTRDNLVTTKGCTTGCKKILHAIDMHKVKVC